MFGVLVERGRENLLPCLVHQALVEIKMRGWMWTGCVNPEMLGTHEEVTLHLASSQHSTAMTKGFC